MRNVGVVGRSLLPSEPELGALGRMGFVEFNGPEQFPGTSDTAIGLGDEGGKAVAPGVEERRSLFVDMAGFRECAVSGLFSIVFNSCKALPLLKSSLM